MADESDPLLHPFGIPSTPESWYRRIVRGDGVWVTDADGNRYLDGMASLWYCQVGHGRTEIADAVREQLATIDSYHTFPPFSNGPAVDAAAAIVERSPIAGGRVLFASSGSEAVDQAIKLVRHHFAEDDPARQVIVSRSRGYHGTALGGTAAQGIENNRSGWGELPGGFVHVAADDVDAVAAVLETGRVAAVIAEPVQGAGGVWPPPEGYWPELRRLCDEHGALLVADEVICGFGRLGHWFGVQSYGVAPDLITFAKGVTSGYVPLSGVVLGRRVVDRLEAVRKPLATGTTYSGHPAACAAALTNIAIIEREGLLAAADRIAGRLGAGLAALVDDGLALSHRGAGAIWAFETERPGLDVRNALLDEGLVLRPLGTTIAICPPLIITDDELDWLLDTVRHTLTRLAAG